MRILAGLLTNRGAILSTSKRLSLPWFMDAPSCIFSRCWGVLSPELKMPVHKAN